MGLYARNLLKFKTVFSFFLNFGLAKGSFSPPSLPGFALASRCKTEKRRGAVGAGLGKID